jgi:hypothetical protein
MVSRNNEFGENWLGDIVYLQVKIHYYPYYLYFFTYFVKFYTGDSTQGR